MDGMYTDILVGKNMISARQKLGSLLHTIQDFYSHSNWIEMGNVDRIYEGLGSEEFLMKSSQNGTIQIVSEQDVACFSERCVKKVLKCSILKSVASLVKHFRSDVSLSCPLVYFKCKDNVNHARLTSGYFAGQRLDTGENVTKPVNGSRCSHGGVFDLSSLRPAEGGINKDTGYYFVSPRADLHLVAAELATRHTAHLLDQVRARIGNFLFDDFLELFHTEQPSVTCFFKRILSYV